MPSDILLILPLLSKSRPVMPNNINYAVMRFSVFRV